MKRRKCKLIPIEEYDGRRILFSDDNHNYIAGAKEGYFIRIRKKTCFFCCKNAVYAGIFNHKTYGTIERYCEQHALEVSDDGTLPVLPNCQIPITEQQKIAIQRWTNNTGIKI